MTLREQYIQQEIEKEKLYNGGRSLLGKTGFSADDAGSLFLSNGLEYIDPILHKPLYRYFALRDIPHMMVGGALETSSYFKTNYSINTGDASLASGNGNVITLVKAQLEKFSTRIQPRAYMLEIGHIDSLKAKQVGFDVMSLFDEGVRHQYNLEKDNIAYNGLVEFSVTSNPSEGLINASNVPTTTLETPLEDMTGTEIVSAITGAILDTYSEMAFDARYLPDRLLVDPAIYKKLVLPLAVIGESGATATTGVSVLQYLKQAISNTVAEENISVAILPLPYLATAGTAGTGRMVLYKYDSDVLRLPIGMDLTRGATLFDISSVSTKTLYTAFIGELQILRKVAIRYIDNISE